MLTGIALDATHVPNAWLKPIKVAWRIEWLNDKNLTYAAKEIRVRAGEPIAITLRNPESASHHWALVQPGSLQRVGELTTV